MAGIVGRAQNAAMRIMTAGRRLAVRVWRALTGVRKKGRSGVRAQMRRPTRQRRAEGEALQSEKKREKPTDAPHDLPQSSEWLNVY